MASFEDRMKKRGLQVMANTEKAKRILAIEILGNVVRETPVDTGRARNNWLVGIGAPEKRTNVGTRTTRQDTSGDQQVNRGINKIGTQSVPGKPIWISNNLPYIEALNNGSSKQSPAGFVERAIQLSVQNVKSSLRLFK